MAVGKSDGSIILSTRIDDSGIKRGFGNITAMAGKAFAAIGVAAGTATVAITKMAVDAYAEYEQLVGGVETLFKGSSAKVMQYAHDAYKTAGLSANEYMQSVTSFSASLLNSLGGDTDKAADVANSALIAMADNVNKMGSSYESVQMAFQGFAKGQYTLLDNLKLGYGGTKTEMERLLKDAQAITKVEYDIDNLADVYTAIGVIQDKLGITGTTAKEASTTINGAAQMMKASWENVLIAISSGEGIDKAIENLVTSITLYFRNITPVVERSLQGIGTLIAQVAPMLVQTVAQELIKAIPQLLVAIYQMIIGLAKGIAEGIKSLFAGTTRDIVVEQTEAITESVEQTAENQNAVTDAVKKTNKELKKSMAGFDEIQTLSSGTIKGVENVPSLDMPSMASGVGAATSSGAIDGSPYIAEVDRTLMEIMAIAGTALAAIGLILLFSGNIGYGVGFLVAGAATLAVTMAMATEYDYTGIVQMLTTIMAIAGGALLALGIILLWIGGVVGLGVAIGMIVAGGALIVSAVAAQAAFAPEDAEAWLTMIMGIAGGALLALGIVLCIVGSVPLGVGMIIAGSTALVAAFAVNSDMLTEMIDGEVAAIMALVGGALLVIGIILVCTGVIPLGIALIAAGAISLVTPIVVNGKEMGEIMVGFFKEYGGWIAGASIALLVIGIILVCCGMIPLGIGLIAVGAVGLGATIVLNWDAIVDWLAGIWEAVKGFWNKYIAPIFTAKFWLDLAKKCGNGLIEGFENAINGIIGLFEKMINWIVGGLNRISFDVPEWVPGIGGSKFGFSIPEVKFGRVSIPRLARGAVIPPNREFLAVLGDQKQGMNIEAPLQTIVDAFNIALDGRGGGNNTAILEIDGEQFGRIVYRLNKQQSRRVGVNFSEA